MSSKGEKNTCSKVLLANITSSFSTREFQFMLDEEGNGFNFNHSQIVATMGCLLQTHTHTLFFWVWFCVILHYFCKIRIFFWSQSQWSLGKKWPKSPSKKILIYLYMVQVSSQKYIRIFNFFLPIFNSQIWLNRLMGDHHLSYITKLKKTTAVHTHQRNYLKKNFTIVYLSWEKLILTQTKE
jgi:hypothetical protein